MSPPSAVRRGAAGLAAILALAVAACGGGSEEPSETAANNGLPAIEHDEGPQDYRAVVGESLRLLSEYWSEELAAEGEDSQPPKALVSYWNRRQDQGCGGQPAGPANAQYCSLNDTISWDGNWLYGELYEFVGDAAVAFLLAHEYGHLVQNRVGVENDFELTIEAELNADCLAGAWFGAVDENIARLDDRDYDALYGGVLNVADPKGLPWQNPQAHGTASERRRALSLGARRGEQRCLERLGPGFSG